MDWSINLTTQAYQLGYRISSGKGTYDNLQLYRNHKIIRVFEHRRIPNIYEIEEVIKEIEGKDS